MATGTIQKIKAARLTRVPDPTTSPLRNYTLGTTVTVPELAIRPYDRHVIVVGGFANNNGLMHMPSLINVPANSQQITVTSMWNTQTNSLQTSGSFDIRILDVEMV